ncbi:hypothetical protein WCLP8_5210016 [uncultured Gammaproteobacteria bacterium]
MSYASEAAATRTAAKQRDESLASIAIGASMLSAALRQLHKEDAKLARMALGIGPRLQADEQEVGRYLAEMLGGFLPAERYPSPVEGVRPLQSRVADGPTVASWAAID